MYIRVWEYEVPADRVGAFLAAYGKDGDWARLFTSGDGYLGTELYRGAEDADRFVTVDRWTDEPSWHAFLGQWREAYDGLGERLADLCTSQRALLEG